MKVHYSDVSTIQMFAIQIPTVLVNPILLLLVFLDNRPESILINFNFSHRFHVRGSGYPGHQRPASTSDRFSTSQVHERDQKFKNRNHSLRNDATKISSLQRHTKTITNAELPPTGTLFLSRSFYNFI